jgi:hypothetical protein
MQKGALTFSEINVMIFLKTKTDPAWSFEPIITIVSPKSLNPVTPAELIGGR